MTGSPIRTRFVFALIPCLGETLEPASTASGPRDMSAVSAWPERLVTTAPSVTKKAGGDGVVLSLAGPWIVGAGKALETGAASLMSEVGGAKSVILDLSAIQRLDTAGAWVIDRARAQLAEAGASVDLSRRAARTCAAHQGGRVSPVRNAKDVRPSHGVVAAFGGRRDGLRVRRGFRRHRRLPRRNRHDVWAPRPASVALALDLDGLSPREVFAAQRARSSS